MKKAFIYCRVSTEKQETERQLRDLRGYCLKNDFEIVDEYQENISATKSSEHRRHFIDAVKKSGAKYVLVQDISRFSRNVKVGLILKDELHEIGVCLIFLDTNMHSLNEDGTPNSTAEMMFTMLMSVYQMENTTKREMIKSGLRNAVANGSILGRPKGSTIDLLAKHKKIVKYLIQGNSIRNTALLMGGIEKKSLVQRVKKQLELNEAV
jgi:DNA invertase Pin-like site-specific DNA recombinase